MTGCAIASTRPWPGDESKEMKAEPLCERVSIRVATRLKEALRILFESDPRTFHSLSEFIASLLGELARERLPHMFPGHSPGAPATGPEPVSRPPRRVLLATSDGAVGATGEQQSPPPVSPTPRRRRPASRPPTVHRYTAAGTADQPEPASSTWGISFLPRPRLGVESLGFAYST